MLQKFIHYIAYKRHPWRHVAFDQLAEIYTSMTLRSLGFSLIGIFVPVFLYQNGVSIQAIFLFYVLFFMFRIPVAVTSAYVIGRVGPKHALGISTLLYIAFLLFLLSYTVVFWPLWLLALIFSMSNGLFFIAINTDFSKIKDSANGGKELSYLLMFEKIGAALGPLFGGLLATFVSPQATIFVAIFVLLGSQIPLLLSSEPVRTHQHITFRGFKWKKYKRDYVSLGVHSIDRVAVMVSWPLLLALTVFATDTYAKLGSLVAFTTLLSLFAARLFGRIIDRRRGLELLKFGTYAAALIHFFRPFSLVPASAVTVSAASEPVTLAHTMPLVKAYFDRADTIEGYRIVYLSFTEMILAIFKIFYWLVLFILCFFFDPISVLTWSFIAVGLLSLGVLSQRFPALKKV